MNSNICFFPSLIGSWIERENWKVYGKETSEKNTIYFSLFGIVVKRKGSLMEIKFPWSLPLLTVLILAYYSRELMHELSIVNWISVEQLVFDIFK